MYRIYVDFYRKKQEKTREFNFFVFM